MRTQPPHHDRGCAGRITPQVVPLTGPDLDLHSRGRLRNSEGIPLAVDHKSWQPGEQLGGAGAFRGRPGGRSGATPGRRAEREGERDDTVGVESGGGSTGDPGTAGSSADDQGWRRDLPTEHGDHGAPRLVEVAGRRGNTPTRHAVGLRHSSDSHTSDDRRIPKPDEIGGVDSAARTVAENEQTEGCSRGTVESHLGGTARGVDDLVANRHRTQGTSVSSSRVEVSLSSAASGFRRLRQAISIARRSRGVVPPQTPWQSPTSSAQARQGP